MYPEKHIFDIAGYPKINGQEYVDRMVEQGLQFGADVRLGENVKDLERVDGRRRGAVAAHAPSRAATTSPGRSS